MTQSLLSSSPLAILEYSFQSVEVKANSSASPEAEANLTCARKVQRSAKSPDIWKVSLEVKMTPKDETKLPPYSAKVQVCGRFRARESYPEHKWRALMEVAAASILYGSCREMLATLTGRCDNGVLSLPSVAFLASPDDPAPEEPPKKSAKKKSRRVAPKGPG